ncbi:MAG: FGGY family carbohydrate kinase [Mediterraneibacter gnavus]
MEKKLCYLPSIRVPRERKRFFLIRNGHLVCRQDLPHTQWINEKGWVSHDLTEIYQNTIQAVKNVVEASSISKKKSPALVSVISGKPLRHGRKRPGNHLADAIVWQCARAEEICAQIRAQGWRSRSGKDRPEPVSLFLGIQICLASGDRWRQ